MAHNLENSRSMFWTGDAPWHGLGVKLPGNATWEEASTAVGFYRVDEVEVYAAGNPEPVPGLKALKRGDDGRVLSVVGQSYGVVDFADMAQAVMTAAGAEAVFHTGGLLGKNGQRGWLLGELGEPIRVRGDESEIRRYFLATTAHTGADPVDLLDCATRVVCQNTLGTALSERGNWHQKIRHTKNAAERVQAAAIAFRDLSTGYERFGQLANLMAATSFTDAQFEKVTETLFPAQPETGKVSAQAQGKREKLTELFCYGRGITHQIRGTAWAAFQALTEYADHHTKIRALPEQTGAARLESIWMGSAAELKKDGLRVLAEVGGFKVA